jgi:hypothetical protein
VLKELKTWFFASLLNNYTLLGDILDCKIAILHEHFEEIKINDHVL